MKEYAVGCLPCHNFQIGSSEASTPDRSIVINLTGTNCKAGITSKASKHCIYADKELNESMSHGKT